MSSSAGASTGKASAATQQEAQMSEGAPIRHVDANEPDLSSLAPPEALVGSSAASAPALTTVEASEPAALITEPEPGQAIASGEDSAAAAGPTGVALSAALVTSNDEKASSAGPSGHVAAPVASAATLIPDEYSTPPSVRKRRMPPGGPKGILKPAPPPSKSFSFRRDILQSLNSRLAQGGVGVQVPVPAGNSLSALSGSAQGTAQAAGNLIGGVFKKLGGLAAGVAAPGMGVDEQSRFAAARPSASPATAGLSQHGSRDLASPTGVSTSQGVAPQTSAETPLMPTNTLPAPASSPRPLRRVQFRVSSMRITYPIHGGIAPGDEDATRRRVEKEHRESLKRRKEVAWTVPELEKLYRECCRTREEYPLKKMRAVFEDAQKSEPPGLRTMDLSFVPLDRAAIEPISDLLSIDFGLQKLVLENCGLGDDGLKSILHALLVSGTLPTLSLAANRRIKYHGWRLVGIYMRRARALRYLDLSENSINKASLEHIIGAIAQPKPVSKASDENLDEALDAPSPGMRDVETRDDGYDDEGQPLMPDAELLREQLGTTGTSAQHAADGEGSVSGVISLRLENCNLKTSSLEALSAAVRHSDLRHLSLRRNRIAQLGAVALALMLKDYPDTVTSQLPIVAGPAQAVPVNGNERQQSTGLTLDQRLQAAAQGTRSTNNGSANPSAAASLDVQDTVPYAVRSPKGARGGDQTGTTSRGRETLPSQASSSGATRSYSPSLPEVPLMDSSPGGGVTSRRRPVLSDHDTAAALREAAASALIDSNEADGNGTAEIGSQVQTALVSPTREIERTLTLAEEAQMRANAAPSQSEEEAAALFQAKRAKRILADMPRVGNLLTLDLKGNDIRGGVAYLAQSLKKNRTLRVLNLGDNNIDMSGLIAVADALKYNSTLETLDMSHNPCAGPSADGITRLRLAFALNSNVKRLFLNDTDLSSEGAIALAEYLPESRSLIHLDLTDNHEIDIAGVMALAVASKQNKTLRCLDVTIPPNEPDFARLSRDIMQSCVRNTEAAQRKALKRGIMRPIPTPIHRSVVALSLERQRAMEAAKAAEAQAAQAQATMNAGAALVSAATECRNVLRDLLRGEEERKKETLEKTAEPASADFVHDLLRQSRSLRKRVAHAVSELGEGSVLEQLLTLNDELEQVSSKLAQLYQSSAEVAAPRINIGSGVEQGGAGALRRTPPAASSSLPSQHLETPVIESGLSSPSFSIGSDEDEDEGQLTISSVDARSEGGSIVSEAATTVADTSAESSAKAAREEAPDVQQQEDAAHSPTTGRAKGQLSEEGELFRKAVALHLEDKDEEEDEEDRLSEAMHRPTEQVHSSVPSDQGPSSLLGVDVGHTHRRRRSSNASSDSGASSLRQELPESGEELRAELLTTDVPRSSSSSGGLASSGGDAPGTSKSPSN